MRNLILLLIALSLIGCTQTRRSPGRSMVDTCDPCGVTKNLDEMGKANVAAAEGGLSQELAPVQGDKVPFHPQLTYGAGAGDTSTTDSSQNSRRQVTSGNQYNGMFNYLPNAAESGDRAGGGCSVYQVGLSRSLRRCHEAMAKAEALGDLKAYEMYERREAVILEKMQLADAAAAGATRTEVKIDLGSAKNQNLASAISDGGASKTPEESAASARKFEAGASAIVESAKELNADYEDSPGSSADLPDAPADDGTAPGSGEDGE